LDGKMTVMDLPDDLALPLRSGAPYWYWLGGRPALDLVNTLRERWWRRVETLVTPGDLAQWLVAAGVTEAPPRVTRADLERARTLREAIDAAVEAAVGGGALPASTAAALDGMLAAAPLRETVALDHGGAVALATRRAGTPAAQALAAIALDAAAMLAPDALWRIRVCASQTCSARFFDRSPAGRRRWCSMQDCGNVEKARRHRRRAREQRQEQRT
jgi:predicted RNA-binding Zn ribbon-like protein